MKTTKGKPIILFLGVYIHLLEQNGAHINKLGFMHKTSCKS